MNRERDSLSAPTRAELMTVNEQRRSNDINDKKFQLERDNKKILIANCVMAAIIIIIELARLIISIIK